MTEKICSVCGKTFDAKADYQKMCLDCYTKQPKNKETAFKNAVSEKGSGKSAETKGKVTITAEVLRQSYDEVTAAFADVIDDVKDYLGGWTTTIALSKK